MLSTLGELTASLVVIVWNCVGVIMGTACCYAWLTRLVIRRREFLMISDWPQKKRKTIAAAKNFWQSLLRRLKR